MSFSPLNFHVNSFQELLDLSKNLKQVILNYKLVHITGVNELNKDDLTQFALNVSEKKCKEDAFIFWDFGYLMDLKESENSENYLFSKEEVPFHWDGAFHIVPHVLLFQGLHNSCEGRTLFTDTHSIYESLSDSEKQNLEQIKISYTTEKLAHYGGSFEQAVVSVHPLSGNKVLHFGEEVNSLKNPVIREIIPNRDNYLISKIEKLLRDDRFCYRHQWNHGDILLADNYALLHAREAFGQGNRHIRRIQIK